MSLNEGYHLMFEDDSTALLSTGPAGNVELHPPGWSSEELQEYVDNDEVVRIEDGKLLLRAVKRVEKDGSVFYTSGRVSTPVESGTLYLRHFRGPAESPTGQGTPARLLA